MQKPRHVSGLKHREVVLNANEAAKHVVEGVGPAGLCLQVGTVRSVDVDDLLDERPPRLLGLRLTYGDVAVGAGHVGGVELAQVTKVHLSTQHPLELVHPYGEQVSAKTLYGRLLDLLGSWAAVGQLDFVVLRGNHEHLEQTLTVAGVGLLARLDAAKHLAYGWVDRPRQRRCQNEVLAPCGRVDDDDRHHEAQAMLVELRLEQAKRVGDDHSTERRSKEDRTPVDGEVRSDQLGNNPGALVGVEHLAVVETDHREVVPAEYRHERLELLVATGEDSRHSQEFDVTAPAEGGRGGPGGSPGEYPVHGHLHHSL